MRSSGMMTDLVRTLALAAIFAVFACSSEPRSDESSPSESQKSKESPPSSPKDSASEKSPPHPSGSKSNSGSASPSESDDEEDAGESDASQGAPKFDLGALPEAEKNPGPDCDCEEGTDLIYLLDRAQKIWLFDPKDNKFTDLGPINCNIPVGSEPVSMAIDRFGVAWIQIKPSGHIYHVDTKKNNTCKISEYDPKSIDMNVFGMAFSDLPEDDVCEQLFMHSFYKGSWAEGPDIGSLGRQDPDALAPTTIGRIDYDGGELTGTSDGRLFAFAGTPGAKLIEYNPRDASEIKTVPLRGLELTYAMAFAFWGGDIYFFTLSEKQAPYRSKVTKLDYDGDGSLTNVVQQGPLTVVGAGVSICAPLEPPPG